MNVILLVFEVKLPADSFASLKLTEKEEADWEN